MDVIYIYILHGFKWYITNHKWGYIGIDGQTINGYILGYMVKTEIVPTGLRPLDISQTWLRSLADILSNYVYNWAICWDIIYLNSKQSKQVCPIMKTNRDLPI